MFNQSQPSEAQQRFARIQYVEALECCLCDGRPVKSCDKVDHVIESHIDDSRYKCIVNNNKCQWRSNGHYVQHLKRRHGINAKKSHTNKYIVDEYETNVDYMTMVAGVVDKCYQPTTEMAPV